MTSSRSNKLYPYGLTIDMLVSKKRRNSLIAKQENVQKNSFDPLELLPKHLRDSLGIEKLNKMQKESFNDIYGTDDNCVVSAPTGSGKTALCEIAIVKLLFANSQLNSKILYIAPTKSLCFEKYETWKKKFSSHNITVGILTSDTESYEVENIKNSNIIVTTPEKWDLLTRRWFDYIKLFDLIKLLLVDEIHILRNKRGATLEAVITRMKRMCKSLRIIALSATLPNVNDISIWLRKKHGSLHPAKTLIFNEEYRPVQLSRIVLGFKNTCKNIFQFDFVLNSRLAEIIKQKSQNKPVLVFCPTRKSVSGTAVFLSTSFAKKASRNVSSSFDDKTLQKLMLSGVGYHHAGLSSKDRKFVEKAFIKGEIKFLCSTSTLAVGVNLPAYMVVIKGTKSWQENGIEEYSELDILQMIGRAGRPQFETSGCAVILTEDKNKKFYEKLIQGSQKLESCLHKNLLENLAVELSLKTVCDVDSAVDWLSSTFFYTRYNLNPSAYYEVEGLNIEKVDERLAFFCEKQLHILQNHNLIEFDVKDKKYKSTVYGHSMSKHYVLLETMKLFIKSKPQNSLEQIFNLLCTSSEFDELKLKHIEKRLFRQIASSKLVKFIVPKPQDGLLSKTYKVNILLQFELGGIDFPNYDGSFTLFFNFNNEKHYLFQQAPRLLKCLCDVFSFKHDSISLLNTLELLNNISSRCWTNSPLVLRHLKGLNLKSIKKLISKDVHSITELKEMSPQKIEQLGELGRGFGNQVIQEINELPQYSIKCYFESYKKSENEESFLVKFSVTAQCTNEQMVIHWNNKFVQTNILVGTSDGKLIVYKKVPCCKLVSSITFYLDAVITKRDQIIKAHIFSENIPSSGSTCILNLAEIPDVSFLRTAERNQQSVTDVERFSEFDEEDEDSELDRMLIKFTDSKNTSFNPDTTLKNDDSFNRNVKRKMESQDIGNKTKDPISRKHPKLNDTKKHCSIEDFTSKFDSVRKKIELGEKLIRESTLNNTAACKDDFLKNDDNSNGIGQKTNDIQEKRSMERVEKVDFKADVNSHTSSSIDKESSLMSIDTHSVDGSFSVTVSMDTLEVVKAEFE